MSSVNLSEFLFNSLLGDLSQYGASSDKSAKSRTIQSDVNKLVRALKEEDRPTIEKKQLVEHLITQIGPHTGNFRPRAVRMQGALRTLQVYQRELPDALGQEE